MTLQEKLEQVPDRPGVYLYKDAKAQIVYVGKAASLRSRVRSYFQDSRARDPKTDALVAQIRDLDVIVTANELEAMILESNLVKKHRPRYNIILRDDKHYPFLKLTTASRIPGWWSRGGCSRTGTPTSARSIRPPPCGRPCVSSASSFPSGPAGSRSTARLPRRVHPVLHPPLQRALHGRGDGRKGTRGRWPT